MPPFFICWHGDVFVRLGHRKPYHHPILLYDCFPMNYSLWIYGLVQGSSCEMAVFLSTFMCVLTTKVVLKGKAPKTTFELEAARESWMGHLCSQLLWCHAGRLC